MQGWTRERGIRIDHFQVTAQIGLLLHMASTEGPLHLQIDLQIDHVQVACSTRLPPLSWAQDQNMRCNMRLVRCAALEQRNCII